MSYYRRNYQKKELSIEQKQAIYGIDALVKMVIKADIVLLSSPMHNFGMPGLVKLWFDSIIIKGETFDYNENGSPVGLLKGKKQ